MNFKSLLLTDETNLRFSPVVDYVNEKHNLNIIRNQNDNSLFKWVSGDTLVNISFCPHKTLIPINFKYIKEGLKDNKNMIFIFKDDRDNITYMWKYDETQVMINYNYNEKNADIEYISIFDKHCEII